MHSRFPAIWNFLRSFVQLQRSCCFTAVQFGDISRFHILQLIASIPPGNLQDMLRSMIAPRRQLNSDGQINKSIFRFTEYQWNNRDYWNNENTLLERDFILRQGVDGHLNRETLLIVPQPKFVTASFPGCSCFLSPEQMQRPFLHSFQMAPLLTLSDSEFRNFIMNQRGPGPQQNRIAASFRLPSCESVPDGNWIVDHDSAGHNLHVTLAVAGQNIDGVEVDNNRFRIPQMMAWNWQLCSSLYVFGS